MQITTNKQVIYGDGVDVARVELYGVANNPVTYTVNGVEYNDTLEDIGEGVGYLLVEVTCDTPNMTIAVACEGQRVVLLAGGLP